MPDLRRGVLITRPEPGAGETAARVAALGLTPIVAPLLAIRVLGVTLPAPERLQAILVTSGNAVASLPPTHRHLPLFAVGEATAARARAAGFAIVTSADGDAAALASLVAGRCAPTTGALLLAAGRGQGEPLAARLREHGFKIVRRAVYAAMPVPSLPDAARDAFAAGALTAVMVFSAETARHCVRVLRAARLDAAVQTVDALAIGRQAAVALQALPWRRVLTAARPNQDAMLTLLR